MAAEDSHSKQAAPVDLAAPTDHTRRRRRHVWRWVLAAVVLVVGIAGALIGHTAWSLYHSVQTTTARTYTPLKKQTKAQTKAAAAAITARRPISILLLGTDTGALGRTEARGRTDSMILVTINPKAGTTTMVSIPRDTMSQMIGYYGVNIQKINAAYSIGATDMTVNSVAALLNVPIQHYAMVNMGGLEKVIDAVGGVDVTVPFTFTDDDGNHFAKGPMHLNGKSALAYVRMRHEDPRGDYGRTARQRQVITGILKAAPSFKSLSNFKALMAQIQDNFRSSLSFEDMVALFSHYRAAADHVKEDHLQGVGCYLNGSSYQIAPTQELQRVSDELRTSLGLSKATLHNEETRQNALNPNFDWSGAYTTGYTVYGADRVN
ncbi:LCP family protein [Lacticaseibacillus kribbianus]|uniref:LCP family glycopolymer transferase n=1 Tax=Lacticaseibacillus kribbianus TaxID=2926292 RepID=UPI001CD51A94|nr:LCP family protein [Lacticaseibacillus kribbianus]